MDFLGYLVIAASALPAVFLVRGCFADHLTQQSFIQLQIAEHWLHCLFSLFGATLLWRGEPGQQAVWPLCWVPLTVLMPIKSRFSGHAYCCWKSKESCMQSCWTQALWNADSVFFFFQHVTSVTTLHSWWFVYRIQNVALLYSPNCIFFPTVEISRDGC